MSRSNNNVVHFLVFVARHVEDGGLRELATESAHWGIIRDHISRIVGDHSDWAVRSNTGGVGGFLFRVDLLIDKRTLSDHAHLGNGGVAVVHEADRAWVGKSEVEVVSEIKSGLLFYGRRSEAA